MEVLPKQSNNGSVKATSKQNRTKVSSNSSNAKQIRLLEVEAIKKQDEIDEELAAARHKAEIRRNKNENNTLTEELKIAKLGKVVKTKHVFNREKELARNGIQLRPTVSQTVTKQLQSSKEPQKCYRTFKASSTSTKPPTGTEPRGQKAYSQKDISGMTSKASRLRSNKGLCFGHIDSKSIVG